MGLTNSDIVILKAGLKVFVKTEMGGLFVNKARVIQTKLNKIMAANVPEQEQEVMDDVNPVNDSE